ERSRRTPGSSACLSLPRKGRESPTNSRIRLRSNKFVGDYSRNSGNDRQHVAGRQDQVFVTGVLDLGAAVLAVDDLVADGHVDRDTVAVVVDTTGTDRDDLALLG